MAKLWNDVFKRIIFGRPNAKYKEFFNDQRILPWTIYGKKLKVSDWSRKFHHLDSTVKMRFLYPLVTVADMILGKKVNTEPQRGEFYDKNVVAFESAWKNTVRDNNMFFRPFIGKENPYTDTKPRDLNVSSGGLGFLETLKRYGLAMVLNDTSWREFFNILLINIAKEMNKLHGKEVNHVLYTSNAIDDINYYMVGRAMDGDSFLVYDIKKAIGGQSDGNTGKR